jgi:hypothetical protein
LERIYLESYELEKPAKSEFSQLEGLAVKLNEVEKSIRDYDSKLTEAEKGLAEHRLKSDVEKRFHELSGVSYEDNSVELEEQLKSLKAERETASAERDKLRREIFMGLSNIIMPLAMASKTSEDEVTFAYRQGVEHQAITLFIKRELNFGRPPVYVTLLPDGVKVIGINDELVAMQELVNAMETLKAKAKEKFDSPLKQDLLEEKSFVKNKLERSQEKFKINWR